MKIDWFKMASVSQKKFNKAVNLAYERLYANASRIMTEAEIDEAVSKYGWPEEYKELYFKDPIAYGELKKFAIDNKIPRPGYDEDEDDVRYWLPYEYYSISRIMAEEIYKQVAQEMKMPKCYAERLSVCCGFGHAPKFLYDDEKD